MRVAVATALTAAGAAAYALTEKNGTLFTTGERGRIPSPNMVMADVIPTRAQQLARLSESSAIKPFDVLIIGGGATGTGCALDAATRGLRTALVERDDWASGTSSKSTKLVHGGVRYLEKAVFNFEKDQLKLVYEALHERKTLLDNAPHLSKPLPILTPCYKWWEIPYYWAGMKMYDLVAGTSNLILSRFMSPAEAMATLPTLAANLHGKSLKGGILYYDGQFDDARLNVALACSAAAAGAAVSNYVECVDLIKNSQGQVVGAKCKDVFTGETMNIHAKLVINATGVFIDEVRRLSDPKTTPVVTASSGAHVTFPSYYLGSQTTGVIIPKTSDGRVLFILPFQGHVLAGTTDEGTAVTSRPRTRPSEEEYILATMKDYLGVQVRQEDVLSSWSGIRPLPSNPKAKAKDTASIVRDHVIFMDDDGLLNITGGKWTTYRRMAQETVDAAVATGRLPLNTRPCITESLKLIGAQAYRRTLVAEMAQQYCAGPVSSIADQQHTPQNTATSTTPTSSSDSSTTATYSHGGHTSSTTQTKHVRANRPGSESSAISIDVADHLVHSYGDRAPYVLQLAASAGLSGRLVEGHPYLEGEVLYATQAEYCMTIEDFIARRSRLAFLDVQACRVALPKIAQIMATAHGWDAAHTQHEIASANKFLDDCFTSGPVQPHALPTTTT